VSIADFDERVFVPLGYFYRIGNDGVFNDTPLIVGNILETDAHFLRNASNLIELLTFRTPIPYQFLLEVRMGQFDWESIPTHENEINRLTADTRDLHHER